MNKIIYLLVTILFTFNVMACGGSSTSTTSTDTTTTDTTEEETDV